MKRRNVSRNPGQWRLWRLAALLCALVVPAFAQDDHGNSPETATIIETDGAPLSGAILPAGDVDYFTFVSSPDSLYVVETSNLGPGSDTFLYLFADDGYTVLAWDDEGGDEEHASRIIFSTTKSAVYFVEVSHYNLSGTGTYDLSVSNQGQAPEDDHGDNPESATLVTPGTPVVGDIEIPGDADFFQFVPQLGNFYDIETFDLQDGSDTFMTLFDAGGSTKLATDDQGGRESNASRILCLATSIDPYYISVVQFLSSSTGGYSLQVADLSSPISATADGSEFAGTIPEPGDVDVYSFQAVQGHLYELRLTDSHSGGFRLVLLDRDGLSELAKSTLGNPNLDFQPSENGEYCVIIREEIAGGDYLFSVDDTGFPPADADFNKDGDIDCEDLMLFMEVWHATATPTK